MPLKARIDICQARRASAHRLNGSEFWNAASRFSLKETEYFHSLRGSMERVFSHFADTISRWTGKPLTFVLCALSVVVWAVSGPFFGFSETWQLIINTGTTIVTFLMVFLIQSTQNRDGAAVQAKLDEIIRAGAAMNDFIGIERLTESEVAQFRAWCAKAKQDAPAELSARDFMVDLDDRTATCPRMRSG